MARQFRSCVYFSSKRHRKNQAENSILKVKSMSSDLYRIDVILRYVRDKKYICKIITAIF